MEGMPRDDDDDDDGDVADGGDDADNASDTHSSDDDDDHSGRGPADGDSDSDSGTLPAVAHEPPQPSQLDEVLGEIVADGRLQVINGVTRAVNERIDAIAAATQKASEPAYSGPIETGNVSLLTTATSDRTCFVQWNSPVLSKGRQVTIDRLERVVTIVPFRIPVEDFSGSTLIIRKAPLLMMRLGPSMRPPVDEWCLLLKWQAEANHFAGPVRSTANKTCKLCAAVADLGFPAPRSTLTDVFRCSVCSSLPFLFLWYLSLCSC